MTRRSNRREPARWTPLKTRPNTIVRSRPMQSIVTTRAEQELIQRDIAVLEAWIGGADAAQEPEPGDVDLCDALLSLERIRRVRAQRDPLL